MTILLTPREKVGRVLILLGWIQIVVCVGILIAVALPLYAQGRAPSPMAFTWVLFLALPILYICTGKAIKRRRDWGRVVGILLGVSMLFGFPIGTLAGAYVLYHLIQNWDQPGA